MPTPRNELLSTTKVDQLLTRLEEAARATADSPRLFIEPARGTLDRAKSKRHHLVFGRRGSGKTSLLRKAGADLTQSRAPTAFVDLEAFKGHKYPDVLLSVLLQTFSALSSWLDEVALTPATRTSFWNRVCGAKPHRPPLDKRAVHQLKARIDEQQKELNDLLYLQDHAALSRTQETQSTDDSAVDRQVNVGAESGKARVGIGSSISRKQVSTLRDVALEQSTRDKTDWLMRKIIDFQAIIDALVRVSGQHLYIFLDDLYHIARTDQAQVLDYFHRILKGRSAWLKVGSIRHRTNWYHHGNPPTGLKLGDDCDEIDLDITLEKHEGAKRFLLQIIDQIIDEVGLDNHSKLLTPGGVDRLVLASGGVARDFLTVFRRAIEVARERGATYRGQLIGAEDVNVAAGEHDTTKRDELRRDTIDERAQLEKALQIIQQFCVDNQRNCFLVERDRESSGQAMIGELVDLRFLHVVKSRTTVRDRQGVLYTVYMLDISQYTGERKRRELQIVRFWISNELDKLRRSRYVFDVVSL